MIPTRLCIIQFQSPNDNDTDVVVVGWHRVDGPDCARGRDDGQDHQRLAAARREADLPDNAIVNVTFADVDVPAAAFEADLGHESSPAP